MVSVYGSNFRKGDQVSWNTRSFQHFLHRKDENVSNFQILPQTNQYMRQSPGKGTELLEMLRELGKPAFRHNKFFSIFMEILVEKYFNFYFMFAPAPKMIFFFYHKIAFKFFSNHFLT